MIDRKTKSITSFTTGTNQTVYFGLKPIQGTQWAVLKDKEFISIVDVERRKCFKLYQSPLALDATRDYFLDVWVSGGEEDPNER